MNVLRSLQIEIAFHEGIGNVQVFFRSCGAPVVYMPERRRLEGYVPLAVHRYLLRGANGATAVHHACYRTALTNSLRIDIDGAINTVCEAIGVGTTIDNGSRVNCNTDSSG